MFSSKTGKAGGPEVELADAGSSGNTAVGNNTIFSFSSSFFSFHSYFPFMYGSSVKIRILSQVGLVEYPAANTPTSG